MIYDASESNKRTAIIAMMFGAFDKGSDENRMMIYGKMLEDLPTPVLSKTIKKIILECKFMPTVSEIVLAAKSLMGSVDESTRIRSWAEAWGEIEKAMQSTPWGRTPEFSRPEIKAAVDSYGWHTLQTTLEKDMATVRAQVRRIYEDLCARSIEKTSNDYVLGKTDKNLLGNNIKTLSEGKQ